MFLMCALRWTKMILSHNLHPSWHVLCTACANMCIQTCEKCLVLLLWDCDDDRWTAVGFCPHVCIWTLQIANSMVSTWQGPPAMKSLFTRMFCCKSCPNIVKTNNFINFQSYFLQKVSQPSKVSARSATDLTLM